MPVTPHARLVRPTRRALALGSTFGLVVALVGEPGVARAQDAPPTSEACVAAYGASQELRLEGKIAQSREKAAFCAQEACPGAVVSSCTKWLTDLRDAQPSISVAARLGDGTDVTDVVIEIDGVKIGDSLTGAPIELDPGKHAMVFTHRGLVQKQDILVSEGIKNRPISVVFTLPETNKPKPDARPLPPTVVPEPEGVPVGPFVLGGVGIAAVGVFGVLAGIGTYELNDLRDTCGVTHSCPADYVDETRTKLIVGDVFLAAGSVALGASVIWLIVHYSTRSPEARTEAVSWSLSPSETGAYGAMSLRY